MAAMAFTSMMNSYTTASANRAEAAFACENMYGCAIIMGAAVAALFFVILSILVGVVLSALIGLVLVGIIHLIIVCKEKSPKEMKQRI